jgi:hypothetical protein
MSAVARLLQNDMPELDRVYFWSSLVIVIVPVGVFSWISWLLWRAYRRRREPDGGGDPQAP